MGLLSSQPLSATVGFALVLFSIFMFSRRWVVGVLILVAIAYVAEPLSRGGDYASRVLLGLVISILLLIFQAIRIAWKGYVTTIQLRVVIATYALVAGWIWIQHGAKSRWWVSIATLCVLAVWKIVISMSRSAASAEAASNFKMASEATPQILIERDAVMLEAIYKAAHGRTGKFVSANAISPFLWLANGRQIEVAIDRLTSNGSIEQNEYGYALKRKGVEAHERRSSVEKKRSPVSQIFNNYGNVFGAYGSGNNVHGNKFVTATIPPELVEGLLAAAAELRTKVSVAQARQIDAAANEVRTSGDDSEQLSRGTRRLRQIATTVGEIGAPLLNAAGAVINALAG